MEGEEEAEEGAVGAKLQVRLRGPLQLPRQPIPPARRPSAKALALGKDLNFAECPPLGTRQSLRHRLPHVSTLPSLVRFSATSLPSARKKALSKAPFAVRGFAELSLPSITLGKDFADCYLGFAECIWHSAKTQIPVVYLGTFMGTSCAEPCICYW